MSQKQSDDFVRMMILTVALLVLFLGIAMKLNLI